MPESQHSAQNNNRIVRLWPLLFLLFALEGLFILVQMATIPADPKNALILGLSLRRLSVMAAVLILTGLFSYISYKAWRNAIWREKTLNPLYNPGLVPSLSKYALILLVLCQGILTLTPYLWGENYTVRALYERLQPLLSWLFWVGLQTLAWFTILCYTSLKDWLNQFIKTIKSDSTVAGKTGLIIMAFLIIWLFIALTKIGITRDPGGWGMPGVPLLEGQIWAVILGALTLVGVGLAFQRKKKKAAEPAVPGSKTIWLDLAIVLLIWITTSYLWINQPYQALSYFAPRERAPNFEVYPSSDAGLYDFVAQNILAGNGFLNGRVITRPLYILFVAGLHAAAGQNYDAIVSLQACFLALFPVMLYLIGRKLNNRLAGLMAAGLAIWRELNAIQTIPLVEVSNSKLIMSDLPTALCISVIVYLTVSWLIKAGLDRKADLTTGKHWMPLWIGGTLGLTMLIRTQVILLLPFILLLALWVHWKAWRALFRAAILMGLGLTLAVAPWLWRNWINTGMILFEQPLQTRYLAQMYSLTPEHKPEPLPGEDDVAYAKRLNEGIKDFALHNPATIAGFTLAHFLNNEIDTTLVFPLRYQEIGQLDEFFSVHDAFWWKWSGNLNPWQIAPVLLSLILMAIGIGSAWSRFGAAGLTPLAIHIAYSLSNAVSRNSGRRWMLPVDWVGYFYYAAGLVQIILWVMLASGIEPQRVLNRLVERYRESDIGKTKKPALWQGALICAGFLLVGSALPLSETLVPKAYPLQTREELVKELVNLDAVKKSGIDLDKLSIFALQGGVSVLKGRALYPKYYVADDGEPGNGWAIYEARPYPRMGFQLVGRENRGVVLQTLQPPSYFPNAADVIVVGCSGEDHSSAALVAELGKKGAVYLPSGNVPPECIISK